MNIKGLIQVIKSKVSLVDVMNDCGADIVTKTGEAWKARCFMHEEKVPSLSVSPKKNLYHCFSTGCTASGDTITFYQQWHNLPLKEAAINLAKQYGIDASKYLQLTDYERKRARYRAILTTVGQRLSDFLCKEKRGSVARAYLTKRGVRPNVAQKFLIGYSPSATYVMQQARNAGATNEEIIALELNRKAVYEDKIIFPVIGIHDGSWLNYGGNTKRGDGFGPKYIGPKQKYPLQSPGPMFGLQAAREHVRDRQNLCIVEGFIDVLVSHSSGFTNTVSILGSNPTSNHYDTMHSIQVGQATFMLDGDKAGLAGIEKVIEGGTHGINVRVGFLPEGTDPDEYIREYGAKAFSGLIGQAITPGEYLVSQAVDDLGSKNYDRTSARLKRICQLSQRLPVHEQKTVITQVAQLSGLSTDDIKDIITSHTDKCISTKDEESLLSSCINHPENISSVLSRIGESNVWSLGRHRTIWNILASLSGKGVKKYTADIIKSAAPKGVKLNGLVDKILARDSSNFTYHLDRVIESHTRRELRDSSRVLANRIQDIDTPAEDILADHMSSMSARISPTTKSEFSPQEQVDSAISYIHDRMAAPPGELPGVNMGNRWKNLMGTCLGWQNGYVYLLSALPKVGKTATALNWAMHTTVGLGIPVLWVNLEMMARDLAIRNLSILSGVANTRLRLGAIGEKEKELLHSSAERLYKAPFYVYNGSGHSLLEITNTVRKYIHNKGIQVVFLDYIQLIKVGGKDKKYWEGMYDISSGIKILASTTNIPVIAMSQLSKQGLEGGSLHQGGGIKFAQDCDMIMNLRKRTPKELETDPHGDRLIEIDFNRHGPQDVYIKVNFDQNTLRCQEVG